MFRQVLGLVAFATFLVIGAIAMQGGAPWLWGGFGTTFGGFPGPTLALLFVFFLILAVIRAVLGRR